MKTCKKYFSTFKLTWKQATDYRFEFIMEMVCTFIPILALIFLWREVYQGKSAIQGYSYGEMLLYVVIARFVTIMITPDFLFDVMGEVQGGTIQHYICKPISYIRYWFMRSIGGKSRSALWSLISLVIIFTLFFRDCVDKITPVSVICYIFVLLLSFTLYFEIAMTISLLSFWFYEISSWYYTLTFAIEFLAGGLFPLTLFPNAIQRVCNVLPFQFLIYYPTSIIVNGVNCKEMLWPLCVLLTWIIIFSIILKCVWREGIKHYELIGG